MIFIDNNGKLNLSNLHQVQQEFIRSKFLHTGIVGGYQSGKSSAATVKAIVHLLQFPNVPIAYYLPTYGLFDDMLVPKLDSLFKKINIEYTYNKADSKIRTKYGEIWMRSMDNPDRIVSYSVGYSIVDEVDVVHPNKRIDAMKRIASRNSFMKGAPNQIDFVSTPEGFAYMYQFFEKNRNENKILLRLKTGDNSENLADGYIQGLREQYTTEQLKAYLDGEFVNLLAGTVYYKFDRRLNHTEKRAGGRDTLHIGIDFNIGNMSGVVHIIEDKPYAVDELTKVYDTDQMCQVIRERFPNNPIIIYPDASGRQRNTATTKTDIEILKAAGFTVKAKNSNPLVNDRVKNMNRMFCDGNNRMNYMVNTHKCTEYTEALERMAYDTNGQPDKSSGFDHITDAAGYFIYWEYPLNKSNMDEYYSDITFS